MKNLGMSPSSITVHLQTMEVVRNCNAPCDYTYRGNSGKQEVTFESTNRAQKAVLLKRIETIWRPKEEGVSTYIPRYFVKVEKFETENKMASESKIPRGVWPRVLKRTETRWCPKTRWRRVSDVSLVVGQDVKSPDIPNFFIRHSQPFLILSSHLCQDLPSGEFPRPQGS